MELVHIIKMEWPNKPSAQLCTGHTSCCFMQHSDGQRWQMSLCGQWLCHMQSFFGTTQLTWILAYRHWRYFRVPNRTFQTFSNSMFGDVQCMFCTPLFKMERSYPNGSQDQEEGSLLAMHLSSLAMWVWFFTQKLASFLLSFMSAMMTTSPQCTQMSPPHLPIGKICSLTALRESVMKMEEHHHWRIIGFLEKREQTRGSGRQKNGHLEMHGEREFRRKMKVKKVNHLLGQKMQHRTSGQQPETFSRILVRQSLQRTKRTLQKFSEGEGDRNHSIPLLVHVLKDKKMTNLNQLPLPHHSLPLPKLRRGGLRGDVKSSHQRSCK